MLAHHGKQVYAVSTSTRGIGLEFTRQLLERTQGTQVVALARSGTEKLQMLQQSYPDRLSIVELDLENQDSINNAVKDIVSKTSRLDLLVNVAGILGDGGKTTPGPERSISGIERQWLQKSLDVNVVGHVMLTQALVPLLKKTKEQQEISKVVNLSARVGSISDNGLGGWYSYRMSKAALNMFTKTSSIELKRSNILTMSIHPGTTDTDLSVPFQKNVQPDKLFTVQHSVNCMLDVIWSRGIAETGKFYAYDGTEIPW